MMALSQFAPGLWLVLTSATFVAALGTLAMRHRAAPGAIPFALLALTALAWNVGVAQELAAADPAAKIRWFKFQAAWQLPTATAAFCFVLDFARPGKWLTRRTVALLVLPPLALLLLMLTNDAHHLAWSRLWFDGDVRVARGPAIWAGLAYALLLAFASLLVLAGLFARSPIFRWPAALLAMCIVVTRGAVLLDMTELNPLAPSDATILAFNLAAVAYFVAFRLGMFSPGPLARRIAIEEMRDGMVVLDTAGRIVELNRSAQRMLGVSAASLAGRAGSQASSTLTGLISSADGGGQMQAELELPGEAERRCYEVSLSHLVDPRGWQLGRVLLLHDMSEQRRAQEQLLEQQRLRAALEERERLARELHDGVGQVLGYVSLQADAARKLLDDGKTAVAATQLGRLAGAARDAHADVREFIRALRAAPAERRPFFAALRRYLEGFAQNYGIRTELAVAPGLDEGALEPEGRAHLFRIIQEALSNARNHGRARSVWIAFERQGDLACVVIEDDGQGFDPQVGANGGLGLRFMRERAAEVGGSVAVQSAPGEGTRVVIELPLKPLEEG